MVDLAEFSCSSPPYPDHHDILTSAQHPEQQKPEIHRSLTMQVSCRPAASPARGRSHHVQAVRGEKPFEDPMASGPDLSGNVPAR